MLSTYSTRFAGLLLVGCLLQAGPLMAQETPDLMCGLGVCTFEVDKNLLMDGVTKDLGCLLQKMKNWDLHDLTSCSVRVRNGADSTAFLISTDEVFPLVPMRTEGYRTLIVPVPMEGRGQWEYQVRGIQMKTRYEGLYDEIGRPHLVSTLNRRGEIIDVSVSTDSTRAIDREKREQEVLEKAGPAARDKYKQVFDFVYQLEAAYNAATRSLVEEELLQLFTSATDIEISKLDADGRAGTVNRSHTDYIGALTGNLVSNPSGFLVDVVFEDIRVYPSKEDEDRYYASFIQHFMFPDPRYQDSDYISLELDLSQDKPLMEVRRAGRGYFSIETDPSSLISAFDSTRVPVSVRLGEWNGLDVDRYTRTEDVFFDNVALQYHHLKMDDRWFKIKVDEEAGWEDEENIYVPWETVAEKRAIVVPLEPKPALFVAAVTPASVQMIINETDTTSYTAGDLQTVEPEQLQLVADSAHLRLIDLQLLNRYYEPYRDTLILRQADTSYFNVEMARLKGDVTIRSIPDSAMVDIWGGDQPDTFSGVTEFHTKLEVTGDDRAPYQVQLTSPERRPTEITNVDVMYIPSSPDSFSVTYPDTTTKTIRLDPFFIQDLARKADLSVQLAREGNTLTVSYRVEAVDTLQRPGKELKHHRYSVSFEPEEGLVSDCPLEEIECINHTIRSGSARYSFNWNIQDGSNPTLTLKRNRSHWLWWAIPSAAAVTTAAILLIDGDNDASPPVFPPPRPPVNF